MKDSGVDWIGTIPEDWKVVKIKNVALTYTGNSISDDKKDDYLNEDKSYPYISTKDLDTETKEISYDNGLYIDKTDSSFKIAPKNSTLLCIEGGSAGRKIAFTNQDVCFVNKLCCIKATDSYLDRYLYYYCSCDAFIIPFNLNLTGLIGGVSVKLLNQINTLLSTKTEKLKITTFLDKKCNIIDSTIEKQKTVIEKLKSFKQSLITEAVTKGLDPNAKMKPSGIDWIGDIPEGWKTIKNKFCSYIKGRIGWQGLKTDEFIEEGPYLVTGTDFENGFINWESCVHITIDRYNEAKPIQLMENDLLITKDGTIGKLAIVKNKPEFVSLNSGIFVVRPLNNKYLSYYLYFVLQSSIFNDFFAIYQGGTTIIHLYQETFMTFSFPLPSINEQQKIIDYLGDKCSSVNKTINDKEKLIEKLTEYKKSLIYECVTGKKEVI